LTLGKPSVTDVVSAGAASKTLVLQLSAMLEKRSEHPLSEAVLKEAQLKGITVDNPEGFQSITGMGVSAKFKNRTLYLGNRALMTEKRIDIKIIENKVASLEENGKTVMFLASTNKLIGILAVADRLKPFAKEAVQELHDMGKKVMLITGDNERVAHAVAADVGIDNVIAGVLPSQKANKIKELQSKGLKVAMVGDGINDAPALTQADVGIAIGSGTDIAIEAGNVVLIKDDLRDVVTAISLSKYTMFKIRQNLFAAFIYNIVLIPVAAGLLFPLTGWLLSPVLASVAMALSSVSVITNSLLMKFYHPRLANRVPMP